MPDQAVALGDRELEMLSDEEEDELSSLMASMVEEAELPSLLVSLVEGQHHCECDTSCSLCSTLEDHRSVQQFCGSEPCQELLMKVNSSERTFWQLYGRSLFAFYDCFDAHPTQSNLDRHATNPRRRLDYEKATFTELKKMCIDRRIFNRIPLGLQCFKFCIVYALKQADKTWTFDFMGLLPELRNVIYGYLLTFDKDGGTDAERSRIYFCHPAILATSRQINAEATEFLYKRNTYHCAVSCSGDSQSGQLYAVQVHNDREIDSYPKYAQPDHAFTKYPGFLRKIAQLQINIEANARIRDTMSTSGFPLGRTNIILAIMVSFLQEGHALTDVRIHMRFDGVGDEAIAQTLQPLFRLRGIVRPVITGDCPEHIRRELLSSMGRAKKNCVNVLRLGSLLQDQALGAITAFYAIIQDSDDEVPYENNPLQELSNAWYTASESQLMYGFGAKQEEEYIRALCELDGGLYYTKQAAEEGIFQRLETASRAATEYRDEYELGESVDEPETWLSICM